MSQPSVSDRTALALGPAVVHRSLLIKSRDQVEAWSDSHEDARLGEADRTRPLAE